MLGRRSRRHRYAHPSPPPASHATTLAKFPYRYALPGKEFYAESVLRGDWFAVARCRSVASGARHPERDEIERRVTGAARHVRPGNLAARVEPNVIVAMPLVPSALAALGTSGCGGSPTTAAPISDLAHAAALATTAGVGSGVGAALAATAVPFAELCG